MSRAGGRALIAAAIILIAAALAIAAIRHGSRDLGARPPAERPRLLLLTSLPLLFSEDFSLKGGGSPVLKRVETRYRVVPISVSSPAELAKARLLLMAQPNAQTPENLVALDAWVRGGGRVLLLADPMLEWPSKRPLGDPLRPPPMFVDTGLLGHWGMRLDAPDDRGPVEIDGVTYVSPGRLAASSPSCRLIQADIVADCRIGKGRAVVAADADFLNPAINAGDQLLALLDSLER